MTSRADPWKLRFLGAPALILAGLLLAWFLEPGTLHDLAGTKVILCPFRNLTGLPCPGCGMTRAFHHLVHLRFAEAASFNVMAFVLLGCSIVEIVNSVVGAARRGRPLFTWTGWLASPSGRFLAYAFVVAAFAYDGLRIFLIVWTARTPADVFRDSIIHRLLA